MWRRIKKGTKFQLDAGRRSALLLSSQLVKLHFVAESLITSTVKDALSRTPRETFPATRVRVRPRDQPEPDLTTEEERRLIASLRQMHTNLDIPRTTHLQEPYVSLVAARLQFAQRFSCDAMCVRVSNILDPICRRDVFSSFPDLPKASSVGSLNHATLSNCVRRSVVCIPNMSTFRAFRSLCVSLCLLACLYTAIH